MPWKFGKWVDDTEVKKGDDEVEDYGEYGKYGYQKNWWDEDGYDWDWRAPKKETKKGPLSSFWGKVGGTFKGWMGGSKNEKNLIRMSNALNTVSRMGKIVFSDGVKFTWQTAAAVSNSNLKVDHKNVVLDPTPLTSKDINEWEEGERVDALVGDALARASFLRSFDRPHKHSMNVRGNVVAAAERMGVDYKYGNSVSKLADALFHTAAYVYSEAQTVKKFPGYKGYFSKERDFAHRPSVQAQHTIEALQQLTKNPRSIAAAAMATMWETAAGKSLEIPDEAFQQTVSEIAQEIRERCYMAESENEIDKIAENAMTKLLQNFTFEDSDSDSEGEGEGEGEGESDGESESDGNAAGDAVANAAQDLKLDTKGRSAVPQQALSDADAKAIHNAADREYSKADQEKDLLPHVGNPPDMVEEVPIYTIKAESNATMYATARRRVYPLVSKTRASLKFRNEDRAEDELAKRRGNLDDGGVHKLALGDPKVFRRTEIISAPRVDVGILVDESGSMSGQKAQVARETAILLVEALKGMRGVRVSVWGHTGECNHAKDGVLILRYIEAGKGDVTTLGDLVGRAQNFDGFAVNWCAQRMRLLGPEVPNKVLFVLLDGYPCGSVYGGASATKHVQDVVNGAARAGVHVFGIGVGDDVNEQGLAFMYGRNNWVRIPNVTKTPMVMAKLMKRVMRYGNV